MSTWDSHHLLRVEDNTVNLTVTLFLCGIFSFKLLVLKEFKPHKKL